MPLTETNPKVFISYSWTTPDHEEWVLRLATDLREKGVDVILDKWELKEGHDINKFMERMVNENDVKNVIMICDKEYVRKADQRTAGVGIETQIITSEIYGKLSQNKFVAVVTERDQDGNAYLPIFCRSRIYIDLSDPIKRSENFEKLLRCIFDKPIYKKPPLGKVPTFLKENNSAVTLATSFEFRRAVSAIRNNHDHRFVLIDEFLEVLSVEFEKLRIQYETVETFDDLVVNSIESFLPYRNEVVQIFLLLARYPDTVESGKVIHRFLERLIPYMRPTANVVRYRDWDLDNFKFLIHELYLYAVACFINHERFKTAAYLMSTGFYLPPSLTHSGRMDSFSLIYRHLKSLENRNKRLKLRRMSLHADLLKERTAQSGVEFRHLMQADFVLYLRSLLHRTENHVGWWWPITLVYACDYPSAFEIFARSQSAAFFGQVKVLLGISGKNDLDSLLTNIQKNPHIAPQWDYYGLAARQLLGFDQIATTP